MPLNLQDIVDRILQVLEENPYSVFTKAQLQRLVLKGTGSNCTSRVAAALAGLIAAGRIRGKLHGPRIYDVQYKAPTTDSTPQSSLPPSPMLPVLEKRVEDLQQNNDNLRTQVASLKAELATKPKPKPEAVLEVRLLNSKSKVVSVKKGIFHPVFKTVLELAAQRQNILLYGPTGCGKSYLCGQVAESLKLRFGFVSCTAGMSEGVLGGRLLPIGQGGKFEYAISEFVDCYEKGGVFLLDEIDAADPNVLLTVNAALANGHLAVPNRIKKPYAARHCDFICIAAANTPGTGADRVHTGRNRLDIATLDRFQIGKIVMEYDPQVEEQLCPDQDLREHLLHYRAAIRANALERAMSTRFLVDAYHMKQAGWGLAEIDRAFFAGWRSDEIQKVQGYTP